MAGKMIQEEKTQNLTLHQACVGWKEILGHTSLCKAGIDELLMTACAFQIPPCFPYLNSVLVVQGFFTTSCLMSLPVANVVFLGHPETRT